jgi:putative tryptophan/tyrosine transport system substrate-binding protein
MTLSRHKLLGISAAHIVAWASAPTAFPVLMERSSGPVQVTTMNRREIVTLLGGAAVVWPVAARAQQPAIPVVGFLNSQSPDGVTSQLRGFRQGLKEAGFVEGENVAVEYRWAGGQNDRFPELAADLVRRKVAVIVATGGTLPALAAKAATTTIPIVFGVGDDPVRLGLVASLARPGGNVTGMSFFLGELTAKRLELLRELAPSATRVAVLVNPANAMRAEATSKDAEGGARAMGLQLKICEASTSAEIQTAFESLARERPDALFVGSDPFFTARRVQLATLAARHGFPASFASRDNVEVGGLMSYGTDISNAFRQNGVYTGRILKGEKPADLPVMQSTKFELVINLPTAKALGLEVPPTLLARADEVIE